MLNRMCYVQCMIVGMIMLMQSAEAATLAPVAAASEPSTPMWPLLAVLAFTLMLARRPREGSKRR